MTTKTGVGRSLNYDSHKAGVEAARTATSALDGATPSIALVFATTGHDQDKLMTGVRESLGDILISGCSAEGVITEHGSDECSHAIAVMVIASDELRFETFNVPDFGDCSTDAANALADQLRDKTRSNSLLLLFPDGIHGNCSELIGSLESALSPMPMLAGGTAGDLLRFEKTYQYHDGNVHSDSLSAVLINGAFEAEIVVSHGCELISHEHVVSRAEDCFVYEIDGRPAWALFKSYLPDDADTLEAMHIAHLLLAERVDEADAAEPFGEFVIRVPVNLQKEHGALYFAAGLTSGTTVQLAHRDPKAVTDHALAVARSLVSRREGQKPSLVLQLDCAGRGRLLFDDRASELLVAPVRGVIGTDVPWVGLHTYGEIAPVGSRTYFHNYTGVICALYATAASDV